MAESFEICASFFAIRLALELAASMALSFSVLTAAKDSRRPRIFSLSLSKASCVWCSSSSCRLPSTLSSS